MKRWDLAVSRKEMFSASMVLFIGIYYILVFSSTALMQRTLDLPGRLLVMEIKWFITGILYVSGGILLFRKKQAGWIIGVATLLNFVLIMGRNLVALSQGGFFDGYSAIVTGFFVMLLLAFVFLFSPFTRKSYIVNNKCYLLTIALYLVLILTTFWL